MTPSPLNRRRSQRGFSLIEMLLAAFILAIGILGLTMLLVLTVRTNLGSRQHEAAVRLGNLILDGAAAEGRMSWNNLQAITPLSLPEPRYLNTAGGSTTTYYDLQCNPVEADQAVFTVTTTCTADLAVATAEGGRTTDLTVRVQWSESPTYQRSVVLARSVKSA